MTAKAQLETSKTEAKINILQTIYKYIGRDELACIMLFLSQSIWVLSFIYPNEHNFSPFQTMLLRGGTVVILTTLICQLCGYPMDFRWDICSMRSLNIRNIIMTIQGVFCAFVQYFLPLPVVHTIGCSGSIFVCIVDYLRNGVTLSSQQIRGVALGFLGILLVINNKIILSQVFGQDSPIQTEFKNYRTDNIRTLTIIGAAFLLITGIWAYGVVETKKLSNLNTFQINLHFGLCTLLTSAFFYPLSSVNATGQQMIIGIATTGLPMAIGQFLFIAAFGISRNHGKVSIMTFALVLTSYFVSIFRYHESVNIIAIMGTLLALYGVVKCILNKK